MRNQKKGKSLCILKAQVCIGSFYLIKARGGQKGLFWLSSENMFPCGSEGLASLWRRERKAIIHLTFSFPTFYLGQGCCHPDKPLCKYTQKYASLMLQNLGPPCFLIQIKQADVQNLPSQGSQPRRLTQDI